MRMRLLAEREVESLLTREARSRLNLGQQVVLYLDPFVFFKDVGAGRERALSYNRRMRWLLLPYLRRWLMIAASLFLAIAPAEALAAQARIFIIPAAAFAVGASIAIAVTCLIAAVYLLLGNKRD